MDKIIRNLKGAAKILTVIFAWLVGICMVFSYLLQLPNFKALVTKGLEIQTSSIVKILKTMMRSLWSITGLNSVQ